MYVVSLRKLSYLLMEQDLEQIEDWNEHGELRDVINNVEDLDSVPAAATTTTTTDTTDAPPATPGSGAEPKQSTIKIQSPPSTKDETATIAMRQAGQEAALKAKGANNPSPAIAPTAPEDELKLEPQTIPQPPMTAGTESELKDSYPSEQGQGQGGQSVRRPSIPELAGNVPNQRPALAVVPEVAAVSSGNLRADNLEALGLVEHDRGSIVSATSEEEMRRVARDVRQSVSDGSAEVVNAVRLSAREKGMGSLDVEEDKENDGNEKKDAIAAIGTAG